MDGLFASKMWVTSTVFYLLVVSYTRLLSDVANYAAYFITREIFEFGDENLIIFRPLSHGKATSVN
jgi:hypothetical protein